MIMFIHKFKIYDNVFFLIEVLLLRCYFCLGNEARTDDFQSTESNQDNADATDNTGPGKTQK